jgi:hypothetical protein
MGEWLSVCRLADEEMFLAYDNPLLQPGYFMDKELRAMSLHYFAPANRDEMFQQLRLHGCDARRAEERGKVIYAKFKKVPMAGTNV